MKVKAEKIKKTIDSIDRKWMRILDVIEVSFPTRTKVGKEFVITGASEMYQHTYPWASISEDGNCIRIQKNANESIDVRIGEEMSLPYYNHITKLLDACQTNLNIFEDDVADAAWTGQEEKEFSSIKKLK